MWTSSEAAAHQTSRLVAVGRALSVPIRVRMLGMLPRLPRDAGVAACFDYVVTDCDDANESCSVSPGAKNRPLVSLPATPPRRTAGERLEVFGTVRDEIQGRVVEEILDGSRR